MDIMERYERTHGYEFTAKDPIGLEITSRKPVSKNGKIIGYTEIDSCTFEDPKPASFHEDPEKQLPYSLIAQKQYHREVKLEEDAVCYIPSKPLLLLYKIKAARDRTYDLKTRGTIIEPAKVEGLRGKVTEDRADILALIDPNPKESIIKKNFNIDTFQDLVKKYKLVHINTIKELTNHRDSIQLYDPNLKIEQVQEWIKTILK
nr:hypothetical protein [Candidatus Freyarchaeota archaeon]